MKTAFLFLIFFIIGSSSIYAQAKADPAILGTYRSIFEMLREVPGLDVKTTANRTGGTVVIRGIGSLNNQKPPLFVLDGTIYSGDIANINAQDVESISVLKDAASATSYGAQGAAGVILINTKKDSGSPRLAQVGVHEESAYTYFLKQKTPITVFGMDEKIIVKGVIQEQRNNSLIFQIKGKELIVPIKNIARIELIPQ